MTDEKKKPITLGSGFISHPRGRYDEYEEKIRRIYAPLNFIIRHKIAVISVLLAAMSVVFALLFCSGIFIGRQISAEAVYGEAPMLSAKAFLCSVGYEYSDGGGDIWSTEAPTMPGEYRVRAVSKNPLGIIRYSDEGGFVIKPRRITVEVKDTYCQYGDLSYSFLVANTYSTPLAQGDGIAEIKFYQSSESWETFKVEPHSAVIRNSDGEDVTSAYEIVTKESTVTVVPREITVTAFGGTKIYDAKPWDSFSYDVTSGSLVGSDSIAVEIYPISSMPGTVPLTVKSYTITDIDGNDITYKYNVSVISESVTIKKRPLHFTTGSASKTFDNTPLSNCEWSLIEGSLLEGHDLTVSMSGSITYAEEIDNPISISLTDNIGASVEHLYDVNVTYGTLRIDPIVIRFRTPSAEKVYDGTPLTAKAFEYLGGELMTDHMMTAEVSAVLTDVGMIENGMSVNITSEEGVDVTAGYKIEVDSGTLTVTPRHIVITSSSAEKLYDGKPLTCHSYSSVEGELAPGQILFFDFKGTQTEVGESQNTFTVNVRPYPIQSGVMEFVGTSDFTKNYKIEYIYGTLTVLPNPNFTEDSSGEGEGGGEGGGEGSDIGGGEINSQGSTVTTPDGSTDDVVFAHVRVDTAREDEFRIYLREEAYGDYNGKGFDAAVPYTVKVNGKYNPSHDYIGISAKENGTALDSIYIKRLGGCGFLTTYFTHNVTELFGNGDVSFDSDLMEYSFEYVDIMDMLSAVAGFSMSPTVLYDEMAYRDHVRAEYLQIPESTKAELLRIGKENGIVASAGNVALILSIQRYITRAANYNKAAAPIPEDVDDVVLYFLTESKEGVCQHFAAAGTMMFRAYGIPARYTVGFTPAVRSGELVEVEGHTAHAWVEVYLNGIGWIPVEVTGWSNGDEDEPIEIPPTDGKQDLSIMAFSTTKEYDGRAFGEFVGDKYAIVGGKLLAGHILSVTVSGIGMQQKSPGTYINKITSAKVFDSFGKDVTDMYDLTLIDGSVVIKNRQITVWTSSESRSYSGESFENHIWWIASGSLLPEHTIMTSGWKSITDVGSMLNSCNVEVYEGGRNITRYYDITVIPGTLEITEE